MLYANREEEEQCRTEKVMVSEIVPKHCSFLKLAVNIANDISNNCSNF